MARNGLQPGSAEERAFIERNFSIGAATFDSNLSRGFARRHVATIREVCRRNKLPFNPDDWCTPVMRDWAVDAGEQIAWAGKPIARVEDFYDQLGSLYGSATDYQVLRVGGTFSRNRTSFRFDDERLAQEPLGSSIRMPYLRVFWERVEKHRLSGTSVHVIKTLDRLAELWACLDILREQDLHESNPIYMAPVRAPGTHHEMPAVGMRVVDRSKTLLSLPAPLHGHSRYASWIQSERLAAFASEYIMRVRDISDDMNQQTPVGLEMIMEKAFASLKATEVGNYGILDSFKKLWIIKTRMLDWAKGEDWRPVIG